MSEHRNGPQEPSSVTTVTTGTRPQPLRQGLLPFARRHRGLLGGGLVFTCLLVASRLALPLPLIAIVDRSAAPTLATGWADPVALLAAAFVSLALMAGMAEHFQRLAFAKFAGRSINDARSAAIIRIQRIEGNVPGDLATRVMADSARVKQGLKGVLNHVTLNGLLVLGACVALAVTDAQLGLVQLVGAVLVVGVAILGAMRVAAVAAEHRQGEALLTGVIHRLVAHGQGDRNLDDLEDLRGLDAASGAADTNMTRWEGRTTWAAHVVLTVTAAVVLTLGVRAAENDRLGTGALFTVVAYVLLLYGPAVRFARQITRIGSLLVSANHLGLALLELSREESTPTSESHWLGAAPRSPSSTP